MFNIPWFSWFNILAIPLVWLIMWIGMKIEKAPGWQFKASVVGHLSIAAVIVLYWNPLLTKLVHPATYLIAALATGTALYALLPTLYECCKTSLRTVRLLKGSAAGSGQKISGSSGVNEGLSEAPMATRMAFVDGVMDIDDDDCHGNEAMQMVEAFTAAMSPSKSLLDSELVQDAAKELSDEDLQEDPGTVNASLWMTFAGLFVVLGAPLWMSWTVLREMPLLPF